MVHSCRGAGNSPADAIAPRTIIQWLLSVFYYVCNASVSRAFVYTCGIADDIRLRFYLSGRDHVSYTHSRVPASTLSQATTSTATLFLATFADVATLPTFRHLDSPERAFSLAKASGLVLATA